MSGVRCGVRCERCGDVHNSQAPTLAWLGRHAHGTQTVIYRGVWSTRSARIDYLVETLA